ncbi:tyrosine-type recombinase/integrase [Chloroflexota bacterium]
MNLLHSHANSKVPINNRCKMNLELKTGVGNKKVATVDLKFREVIAAYQISNQAEGKSPKTTQWYAEILGALARYFVAEFGACNLSAFDANTVREYVLYLQQKPKFSGHPFAPEQARVLSPRTVQCHVRALKAFSSWLYSEGYTKENRLQNLKLPKAPITIIEPLTPEETKKIIGSISRITRTGARNNAILVTLLDTGLRASEAATITLNNLNLTDGFIKVMGKGAKERIVPIGKYVQMTLWSYIDKVRPEPAILGTNNLFLSSNGKAITVNAVKLFFSRLARSSGVKRLHAHLCRHSFAINYLLAGGDIFSLREILGHTTLEMVNHYLHFTSSQITAQHRKYSPMDKLQSKIEEPLVK